LALAVHPEASYAVVWAEVNGTPGYYLLAESLVAEFMKTIGVEEAAYTTVKTLDAQQLQGLVFRHPLFHRTSPIVFADYVTMDAGTGVVHTAPGHGKEDFETGLKYGLEVLNPVNASGKYTAEAGEWNGQKFEGLRVATSGDEKGDSAANVALVNALRESGNLLSAERLSHSYPHCWRCHSPLIFRATVQWFMNIDHEGFREKALAEIQNVAWVPKESVNRITNMVAGRPDWCVSRQRSWGVGIPAFYCDACGEHILTEQSVAAVAALVRREGSDAWYTHSAAEVLPEGFTCPHCAATTEKLRKETDVLDVWFDSGSTNRAVLENSTQWPDLRWPADVYLEGGDQHRGWFNSSLMLATATKGSAPYKSVVTNGWTLDENGEAFHKSKGNAVSPLSVVNQYGADIVRWWVVSQNFMEDTKCGENVLTQVAEMYRRVRNTFRFLNNNLYDFDPATDSIAHGEMDELDLWALAQLDRVVQTSVGAYDRYEFHRIYQAVLNFCGVELSAFYLDVLKDRLYASAANSKERRSAQTAMHKIAETLARLLAPILVHTCDELWTYLKLTDKPESVHLAPLPAPVQPDSTLIIARWEPVLAARDVVKKALEEARQAGQIGNPLESCVELAGDQAAFDALQPFAEQLPSLFLVSQVNLHKGDAPGLSVHCGKADGVKCARCWLIKTDVGGRADHPDLCARCAAAVP
jgi:isoleucyl-tRNA synthetase